MMWPHSCEMMVPSTEPSRLGTGRLSVPVTGVGGERRLDRDAGAVDDGERAEVRERRVGAAEDVGRRVGRGDEEHSLGAGSEALVRLLAAGAGAALVDDADLAAISAALVAGPFDVQALWPVPPEVAVVSL